MTISTSNGYLYGYLMIIPSLNAACFNNIAYLSSLSEVSIIDCIKSFNTVAKIPLDIEPGFLGLGPNHTAVGINNKISYHKWRNEAGEIEEEASLVCKREYFGTI